MYVYIYIYVYTHYNNVERVPFEISESMKP